MQSCANVFQAWPRGSCFLIQCLDHLGLAVLMQTEVVRQMGSLPNESFWWFKTLHESLSSENKARQFKLLETITKTDVTVWQGPTTVGCSQDRREYQFLVHSFTYRSCGHSSHFGKLIRMFGAVNCRQGGGRKLEVAVDVGLKRGKWQKWMDIGVWKGSSWGFGGVSQLKSTHV